MRRPAIALLLAGIHTALAAQSADGPAAHRARQLLGVINRADLPAIRAFVDSAFGPRFRELPMDAHLNFVFSIRDMSRGLDFETFQELEPTTATALSRMKLTGGWLAIRVRVEPEAPHRIVGIGRVPPPGELFQSGVRPSLPRPVPHRGRHAGARQR